MLTEIQPAKPSSFDPHHAPEKELLSDCVHCGFCLPACPTYVLWGEEMDSPRGRIYMMAKAAQGEAPLDQNFRTHMDQCLGCMACMTACPSGVQYDKLIEDTRAQVERNIPRTTADSLFRKLLFATFPHPARLRLMAAPLFLYQRSGLQSLDPSLRPAQAPPQTLRRDGSSPPHRPRALHLDHAEARRTRRQLRAAASACSPAASSRSSSPTSTPPPRACSPLKAARSSPPPNQPCCGALMVHSGLEDQAAAMARNIIALFEAANVDTIVINAAGCGSTMKEYGHLLRDDPALGRPRRRLLRKVQRHHRNSLRAAIASLRVIRCPSASPITTHATSVTRKASSSNPASFSPKIPQLEVAEIAESSLCCGSAGVYNLLQPEPAQQLGDRKVGHLLDTALAGRRLRQPRLPAPAHERPAPPRREATLPAFHMVELLDASIRGLTADQILSGEKSLNFPTSACTPSESVSPSA